MTNSRRGPRCNAASRYWPSTRVIVKSATPNARTRLARRNLPRVDCRVVFARAQTRYSPLRLLAACGRRGCDAARGDRGRRNAAHIDLRHRQIEEAQHGIGQLIVSWGNCGAATGKYIKTSTAQMPA